MHTLRDDCVVSKATFLLGNNIGYKISFHGKDISLGDLGEVQVPVIHCLRECVLQLHREGQSPALPWLSEQPLWLDIHSHLAKHFSRD